MVSKLIKLLNRDINSMNQAALVLAVFSIVSQIFGLIRDRLLASSIGPSATLDVYYSAFRIPDLVYNSFASLFSIAVLIPIILGFMKEEDSEKKDSSIKNFSNSVYSVYCIGMITISLIVFIIMPTLTKITAPGFSAIQQSELIMFSRIMLLSPFLLGLSSLLGSFAQAQKKFFAFAIAPIFYNLGILIGIVLLMPILGIKGVVIGVVLGALMHLFIQIPPFMKLHSFPKFTKLIDWRHIREIISISLPRTIGLSITNITLIIMGSIASVLAVGSISVFQLSYNIQTTPLMIIGISYAVAAFPALAKFYQEDQKSEFKNTIYRATKNILFLSIPISLLIIVTRAQIVRVLLGGGFFSWNDTRLVAACLAIFSISVTAQSMVLLLVRSFYAKGDTKTPVKINIFSAVITAFSAVILLLITKNSPVFKDFFSSLFRLEGVSGTSIVILPLAFSIGQIINAFTLWYFLKKDLVHVEVDNNGLGKTFGQIIFASIISAVIAYFVLNIFGRWIDQDKFFGVLAQGFLAGVSGLVTYGFILTALKNKDIALFIETLRSKFWKEKPTVPEQPDM